MKGPVLVIGAGLGGLSAAIHARLRGHDVLVVERAPGSGGKARGLTIDGYRIDPGPSIVILPRIYERLFTAAGRSMSDYLVFRRLDPISRVYFEGTDPIDLPADRGRYKALLQEIAPGDSASFDNFMRTMDAVAPHVDKSIFRHPYDQPWQLADKHLVSIGMRFDVSATYKQLIDRWFTTPLLRAFFYGFPSYGGQTYDAKAPGALMIPYLMIEDGVYYPEGGVAAIPTALERLARELGVEFRFDCSIEGFQVERGRLRAANTVDGEVIEAAAFISNVDRLTTRAWLGHRVDWPPSFSYFTIHWGIGSSGDGLRHHNLLIPSTFDAGFDQLYRHMQMPSEPIVYLNATSVEDPATAPPGRTNLFAVATSPAVCAGVDWERSVPEYRERVLGVMGKFGLAPGGDVDFERIQTPLTFQREQGNYLGSLYGASEVHRLFGMFPLRNRDEEYKNLFYCGGSVQPGAGMPMAVLSGEFAAEKL